MPKAGPHRVQPATPAPGGDTDRRLAALEEVHRALQRRLEEAEETLLAIRSGRVDAFVIDDPATGEPRVYSLEGADRPYRTFVEHMQQGAAVLSTTGTVLFGNARVSEMLQCPLDQVRGKPLATWVSEEEHSALREMLEKAHQGAVSGELRLARSDGTTVPVEVIVSPLPLDGGSTLCAILTDLTVQRQHEALLHAQHALRASEERFRAVFEQSSVGLAEIDLGSRRYVRVNAAFSAITGYTNAELAACAPEDLLHPADRAEVGHHWYPVRGGTIELRNARVRVLRKDGSEIPVDLSVGLLKQSNGSPPVALQSIVDLTQQEKAEAMLREADRRKDEFLATLAHELRNPLAPISSAVEILRRKAPPIPELQWSRDVIERQIKQMTRLVDELLDLSRVTRGQITLRREPVSLADVIRDAVETSAPLIQERGHHLDVVLPEQDAILHGDGTRLAQVFSNLLNNAAKYTDPGGRIELRATLRENAAVVLVRDNGIGIPATVLPRIFDMFTQVDRTLERSQSGLGIGLALARRLTELHRGRIEARSAGQGEGSEFVVNLPLADASEREGPDLRPHGTMEVVSRRILVIDDSRDSADTLAMMLALAGHSVRTAYDGANALQVGCAFNPEIVLLDLGMPKVDGHETCRRMRQQPWGAQSVIIALTGWGQPEDRRRTQDSGFDHHLVKPVDPYELTALLANPAQRSATETSVT